MDGITQSIDAGTIGALIHRVQAVAESETCIEVLSIFLKNKELYALPIIDAAHKPVGIVLRQEITEVFSKPYAKELHGDKVISTMMSHKSIVVDQVTAIDDVARIVLDAGIEYMMSGFVITKDGRYAGVANSYDLLNEITSRKQKHLFELAHFDQLTMLPNRRLFIDRLEQELVKAERLGASIALLFIDLDHFKKVNDSMGHAKGDQLLIQVAQRIKTAIRASDTVARLGGDEFTAILTSYGGPIHLERITQTIVDELATPFDLGEHEIAHVSGSIGIALYPDDAEDLKSLLQHADHAMYAAKEAGRNGFRYFLPTMQRDALEKMKLTNDLRYALKGGQLEVYYQPIVEAKTGHIFKAEALLRWRHPTRGMISPVDFIPLAEESRLILEIGEWVFLEAIKSIEAWREKTGQLIQVSVNKSPIQFIRKNRHAWNDRLRESNLPRGAITVEITEGLLLNDSEHVHNSLMRFKEEGVEVSIDDFGTGFSALSYLNKFNVDYLKIDKSFIHNMLDNKNNQALTEAIIVMAHKLGIRTIAEGVETEAQRDMLIASGCDYMQGYLYSRPLPYDQFTALLLASPPAEQNDTPVAMAA